MKIIFTFSIPSLGKGDKEQDTLERLLLMVDVQADDKDEKSIDENKTFALSILN